MTTSTTQPPVRNHATPDELNESVDPVYLLARSVKQSVQHFFRASLFYVLTVGAQALFFLRKGLTLLQRPLAFFIAAYILGAFVYIVGSMAFTLLVSIIPPPFRPLVALFPSPSPSLGFRYIVSTMARPLRSFANIFPSLCYAPIISHWISCSPTRSSPPFSDLTGIQSSSFGRLRNTSVAGSGIALDISRLGAITLPALISMINHTNMTGKDALIDALGDVADQAPLTSRSLQHFGSAVEEGLAVVLGTNKVALHRLEAGIGRPSSWLSRKAAPDVQLFERAIGVFEGAVDVLSMAVVACNQDVNRLQALLSAVEKIVRELHWAESWEREMLLSELWTLIGGNRERLAGYDLHIMWLEEALAFEKKAKEHMVDARFTLDGMTSRIVSLKRKFGQLNLVPGDPVALEIQYEVLATSIRQLTEIQVRGVQGDEVYYRTVRLI